MKSNFNSQLFKKQIELKSSNSIMGGRMSGCSNTVNSGPSGNSDSTTTHYDEDGNITSIDHCNYE